MPFTLAHPAVVLFTPKSQPMSKYFHKPALIIGSMSPDFVYFLAGVPSSKIGHTLFGCFIVNLPLSFIIYYLYQYYIYPYFWQNLPKIVSLQPQFYPRPHVSFNSLLVFISSCFIGMATHIGLDSLTHKSSSVVKQSDWLQMVVGIDTMARLPIYKWFQYGGGILGLTVIGLYILIMARRHPSHYQMPFFDKLKYWSLVSMVTLLGLAIWQGIDPITSNGYGLVVLMVIRLVDAVFLGLILAGVWQKLATKLRLMN